jgi:hypothetical protein
MDCGSVPGPKPLRSLSPDDRKLLRVSLGILAAAFALVSSNVAANHSPKPHGLPIGIVGTPAVVHPARAGLARAAPGAFDVHPYQSLASAGTAVLHRSVYGAFQPVPSPVLLVADAASPPVAVLLQRTFSGVASRSGRALAVRDLVPLPSSDSSGATSYSRASGEPSAKSCHPEPPSPPCATSCTSTATGPLRA